jgi:ribonuclease HI
MNSGMPHFLLFAETGGHHPGGWRFVLRTVEGGKHFEAADVETEIFGDRLDLLTLVRALESLDQPSRVTLVGCSNYIRQGLQYGMSEWRANDWLWEWFGHMVRVKNADLWQRLDRLMAFHQVECQRRRIDGGHPEMATPKYLAPREVSENRGQRIGAAAKVLCMTAWYHLPVGFRQRIVACEKTLRQFASASMQAVRTLRNHFEQAGQEMRNRANCGVCE